MTLEQNKKLILDHYDAFVHRRDAEEVRNQLAPDFVDHEMPPGTPPGPEAALRWGAMIHEAFPDLKIRIEDIIADGDRVAVRASWTGTHRGKFPILDIYPTNRPFVLKGMVFWRISGDRIAERWATMDLFGLRKQLTANS
jgi:predicted ester cyclase